jgi:hypothetical protein
LNNFSTLNAEYPSLGTSLPIPVKMFAILSGRGP